jgi:citrate lyase subunit beta/citryl-CoA lyase
VPLTRSALFVPGNKPDWVAKALASGADLLILDLEDSVPDDAKAAARPLVQRALQEVSRQGRGGSVRINTWASGLAEDDLRAVACPELSEVSLPKVESADDLLRLDRLLASVEREHRIEPGTVRTPLVLETAAAMRNAYDIALACPRVSGLTLAVGAGGDANRSVGYVWSKTGKETLYLRSKAVLDARAAGLEWPLVSSWLDIHDLEGLRSDALFNRSLGFRGQVVMHPSHVPIVNEAYSPTEDEIAYWRGLLEAYEQGRRQGTAAVLYEGDMIDTAMAETAREALRFARSIGRES